MMARGGLAHTKNFFEILTLKQLGRHNKPIVILNTLGYYDRILDLLKATADTGFMKPDCLQLYAVCDTPDAVLSAIEQYDPEALDVRHLKNL